MTSIGDKFRCQREQIHASLEDLSVRTKIGVRFLAAIESDDLDKLPGGMLRKSFVLQYARALGFNAEVIAEELKHHRQFGEQSSVSGQELARPGSDIGTIPQSLPIRNWTHILGGSLGAFLAPVAVILACAGLYSWWQRPKQQEAVVVTSEPASQPVRPAEPPPAAPAAMGTLQPGQASGPQAQAVSNPAAGSPGFQNSQRVRVDLVAGEATWVSASSDGRNVFTDSMQPRQTKSLEAVGKIRLLIGNAGGLEISLNGKPIGPAGPRGQIRIVELTPEGFQIVSPKPPTPEPL
ncbi:MAG: RodZ domain-containing protein [Bryobacteraceae bacterium]